MENQSWLNWRIAMEGLVNDLKETVKEQTAKVELLEETVKVQTAKTELLEETEKIHATKIELLEETVKELRDWLEKLKAEQQFPSRNSNFENPVGRLVRLRGLPADNQDCTSEDAGIAVPSNETREGQEIECICIDEEIELIPKSLATTEKKKVTEARSETLDLDEEIADKKRKNSRRSGTSAKPPGDDHRRSVKNKKCAATQVRSTVTCQPGRRISTMPNSGRGKKNSSGVERSKCTFCLKTFTTVGSLHAHIRTHTGEKPFKCQTCKRAFANSTALRLHMRSHTGEKPFECNVCRKAFARAYNLTVHVRSHTGEKPFKCEVCQKPFSSSADLRNHKRNHTGEKPFKCNFCNKTFAWRKRLGSHIRGHTGEKPY